MAQRRKRRAADQPNKPLSPFEATLGAMLPSIFLLQFSRVPLSPPLTLSPFHQLYWAMKRPKIYSRRWRIQNLLFPSMSWTAHKGWEKKGSEKFSTLLLKHLQRKKKRLLAQLILEDLCLLSLLSLLRVASKHYRLFPMLPPLSHPFVNPFLSVL